MNTDNLRGKSVEELKVEIHSLEASICAANQQMDDCKKAIIEETAEFQVGERVIVVEDYTGEERDYEITERLPNLRLTGVDYRGRLIMKYGSLSGFQVMILAGQARKMEKGTTQSVRVIP
ncbi:MAG: hypothetical protein M0Z43_05870 [Acidithiobacillus sp.]|jgi:hypothetical protein|nr:hypothetical protein [Acidithiobacillus sp.]